MANQLGQIQHIVQLMLENRSLDQMLGFLYADSGNVSPLGMPFEGLTGTETNPDDSGQPIAVVKILPTRTHPYQMPGANPAEGFLNTNLQLFSTDMPAPGAAPTNQGFVVSFKGAIAADRAKGYKDTSPDVTPADIMSAYSPDLLPIMAGLARGFAVCDVWHASAPTQTIPNRGFAAAGTSQGHLSNNVKAYTCPSIYGRLAAKGLDWAIFGYNKAPLTRTDFPDTRRASKSHFGLFADFKTRAAAGTLPAYTFLEPDFSLAGNSQHPNDNVAAGEALIHDVYRALRDGPAWNSTLLLITYDEFGGTYDHVPPRSNAVPPGDGAVGDFGFDFTRFGPRIAAVLVSPLIAAGTVYRGSGPIDHTSVLKTIHERWGTNTLTARDAAAASLGDVLTLAQPRTDDPLQGVAPPVAMAVGPVDTTPSELEMILAERYAALPVKTAHGIYEEAAPVLKTSDDVTRFVNERAAAWDAQLDRLGHHQ
ncbi:MAG TPA: alkaline phosphatase family protein [Caulobacteraceae bacterium]|nr:alkaline phosphatase family protein [Caulobacteraceae bacterium]